MKILRFINGNPKEKQEFSNIKIASEIISSTIKKVNKRVSLVDKKGTDASDE